MKDYYRILGIPATAAQTEIKRAYFGLVRKFPPDRYPKEFMEIREAYEVLIDESTRKQYDLTGGMPDIVKMYYEAGRDALDNGDSEKAIRLLEVVTKVYPKFSVINSLLGDAYYINGNSGKATAIFEKLAEDEPNNAGFSGKLAHAYLKRGWHRKAANQFRRALLLDNDNISLWIGLLSSYMMANEYSEAREIAFKALEAGRRNGWNSLDVYYHLIECDIALMDSEALDKHLDEMKEMARKDKYDINNTAWFLANIGKMLLRCNDAEKAETLLNAAFELAPGDDEIRKIKEEAQKESHLIRLVEKLRSDKSYDRIFADMFEHELKKCNDPECYNCSSIQLVMELQVMVEYGSLRRQIIRLKTAYPELYQLKQQFFAKVMDERKRESIYYEYQRKLDKMAKDNPDRFKGIVNLFSEEDEDEDEDDDAEAYRVPEPARRDANKVGRNDPCPCGSGKKYKKCCGK